jgi:hypothetical protein
MQQAVGNCFLRAQLLRVLRQCWCRLEDERKPALLVSRSSCRSARAKASPRQVVGLRTNLFIFQGLQGLTKMKKSWIAVKAKSDF